MQATVWTTIFQYAAGITSGVSLVAFLGALFVWLQAQKKERSVVETIKGEGIVQPEAVVQILKQFKSDEARLGALREILGYDKDRAADVLNKVKPNVDVGKFSLMNQVQLQHTLVKTGSIFIVLAAFTFFPLFKRLDAAAPCQEFSVYPGYGTEKAYVTDSIQYIDWNGNQRSVRFDPNLDIKYKEWGGRNFEAHVVGSDFIHAPEGDFARSHRDSVIRYLNWQNEPMTATIQTCLPSTLGPQKNQFQPQSSVVSTNAPPAVEAKTEPRIRLLRSG